MGSFGRRGRKKVVLPEHKFEYINLKDFNSTSLVNRLAYIWVYLTILISLLCVAADTYTGISLLAFNRWSSQIKPIIPFEIAKFVFAGCILLSYVLYVFDWFFAIRIIRGGGVADAYMDSFALRWHVIRGGKGREDTGWRRFLVFARLTEKRGKRDYIALFTYFSFKGWARVVFAEGPRVVINTLTLISVIQADLLPDKYTASFSAIGKFFENIKHLYMENKVQVLILSTMAFTTILWVFKMLQLIIACVMYLCYLMRVMGKGTLRGYCKERVDKRMGSIVAENHKVGVKREHRQPTLPLALVSTASPSASRTTTPKPPDKAVIADRLTESPISYIHPRSHELDALSGGGGGGGRSIPSKANSQPARERSIHPFLRPSPHPPRQNGHQLSIATTAASDAPSSRFGSTTSTLVQTPSEASYRGDASKPAGRGRFPIKVYSGTSDYRGLGPQPVNPPPPPAQVGMYSGTTTPPTGMSFNRAQTTPLPAQYGQRGDVSGYGGDHDGYRGNQRAPSPPSDPSQFLPPSRTPFQQRGGGGRGGGYGHGGDHGPELSQDSDDWQGYDGYDGRSTSWPLQQQPQAPLSFPPHPLNHTDPDGYEYEYEYEYDDDDDDDDDDQRLPPPPRSPAQQQQTYSHHIQQLRSPSSPSSSQSPSSSYANRRPPPAVEWHPGSFTPAPPIRSGTAPPSTTHGRGAPAGYGHGHGVGDIGRSRTVGAGYGGSGARGDGGPPGRG